MLLLRKVWLRTWSRITAWTRWGWGGGGGGGGGEGGGPVDSPNCHATWSVRVPASALLFSTRLENTTWAPIPSVCSTYWLFFRSFIDCSFDCLFVRLTYCSFDWFFFPFIWLIHCLFVCLFVHFVIVCLFLSLFVCPTGPSSSPASLCQNVRCNRRRWAPSIPYSDTRCVLRLPPSQSRQMLYLTPTPLVPIIPPSSPARRIVVHAHRLYVVPYQVCSALAHCLHFVPSQVCSALARASCLLSWSCSLWKFFVRRTLLALKSKSDRTEPFHPRCLALLLPSSKSTFS